MHTPNDMLKSEPKSGPSCRRQVVHPQPQTPQGESIAEPGTPLLIIFSIVCKSDIEEVLQLIQSILFYPKSKSTDRNILRR